MDVNTQRGELQYSPGECKRGVCPICQSDEIEYGNREIYDACLGDQWVCPKCGACGEEYENLVFDGHIVKELPGYPPELRQYADKNGNLYAVREGAHGQYRGAAIRLADKRPQPKWVKSLPFQAQNIAQYQLDAYAIKNHLTPVTGKSTS